jgi:hypothetical protein
MADSKETVDLFHLVGTVVAASQIFEIVFVLAARLALKQANIQSLEELEPLTKSKSFKRPVKALLKKLSKAQSIDAGLDVRVSKLVEKRHRVLHRSFLEFGWPIAMAPEKDAEFRMLCVQVGVESQAMSVVFIDLLLTWMKRFPATSATAIAHEAEFKDLAVRIRSQSEAISTA